MDKICRTKKISGKEFLNHCVAQGGNWTAMIMSGIRELKDECPEWKRLWDKLPDKTYEFVELMDITSKLVDWSEFKKVKK